MIALSKLSSSGDYPQQLQGDDLKHARDRKRCLESARPAGLRINFGIRHKWHGGEFQPRRDAKEQTLELIL